MMTLIINKNEPHGSTVIVPPPAGDEPVIKNTFSFLMSIRFGYAS